jgi:hypothetical protein
MDADSALMRAWSLGEGGALVKLWCAERNFV